MRLVAAIGFAMLALLAWDWSGVPGDPVGVAALIISCLVGGVWLEARRSPDRVCALRERAPGRLTRWAEYLALAVLGAVPVGLALVTGADLNADWPVYAGMASVLVASIGYVAWVGRR